MSQFPSGPGVMTVAPDNAAISIGFPMSSLCAFGTRMKSVRARLSSGTGPSGLASHGLVITTTPLGEVRR